MPHPPPDWVQHAVFYQIFPDRFARSTRTAHPPGLVFHPWGTPPEAQGFQGGDLHGVVDRLGYLQDLGVTALYLNPIFASAANHRYHTFDYFQVDPLLGGEAALRELLDAAHGRGMRVVLDGVFNHASRGFWPFHHVLENGEASPYVDWFLIRDWPLRPYHNGKNHPHNYAAWWDMPALPKLNTHNPGVREMIFRVARHWIEAGIDGWRLDVPYEIDDDDFWRAFRDVVKTANPEAYLCGEVWDGAERWLQGDMFDAVMNYLFAWPALSFFGAETLKTEYTRPNLPFRPMDAEAFAGHIDAMLGRYDRAVNHVQLNLLDSHDTARALWVVGDDVRALRLAVLFQMTMPGAPCIYYGDEIGLSAGDDPYCREAFPWDDEASWDHDLLAFYRQATALRHRHPVLRTGAFERVYAAGKAYAFRRVADGRQAFVAFNAGTTTVELGTEVPAGSPATFEVAWPPDRPGRRAVRDGRLALTVPPREALVLVSTEKKD